MKDYSRPLNSSDVKPACSMIDARVLGFKIVEGHRYAQVRLPRMLENVMAS